jgi:hypothetical protein
VDRLLSISPFIETLGIPDDSAGRDCLNSFPREISGVPPGFGR